MTTRRDMLLSSAGAVAAVALNNNPLEAQVATAAAAQQAGGTPLASLSDYEKAAKSKMTPMAWEYISGGAGDEITLAWNHDAYGDIKLRNKVLVDVSKIDTTTNLFGQAMEHPILISPTAYHKLVHRKAKSPRPAAPARRGHDDRQLLRHDEDRGDREGGDEPAVVPALRAARSRVHARSGRARSVRRRPRARSHLDTPVLGARNRETRIGFKLPDGVTRENLVGLDARVAAATHRPPEGQIYSAVLEPRLTWKDVAGCAPSRRYPCCSRGFSSRRRKTRGG